LKCVQLLIILAGVIENELVPFLVGSKFANAKVTLATESFFRKRD
jgi:hypothetical protein